MTHSKHPHSHSHVPHAPSHGERAPPHAKPAAPPPPHGRAPAEQVYRLKPEYSARKMSKPVHFYCQAPGAKAVVIVGDFNDWNPAVHPLKQMPDGTWRIELQLHHGHHQYYFLVDGQPLLDPHAQGVARNDKGERVSLLPVS